MKVAILGASGFIGKNLMSSLPKDWDVYAFYRNTSFPQWLRIEEIDNITLLHKDLSTDYPVTNRYPHHFDLVISVIGNTSHIPQEQLPEYDFNADCLAIMGFFKKFSCDRMIYFSSTCVYENHRGLIDPLRVKDIIPSSSYAISKYMSERLLFYFQKRGTIRNFLIVRLSGAYGPWQKPNRLITRLINTFHFQKFKYISLTGNGENLTDNIYVEDVINFIFHAEKQKFKNDIINFHTRCFIPVRELVETIAEICQIKPKITWDNKPPKENHYFWLTDKNFTVELPFGYVMKNDLRLGITKFRYWLFSHRGWLPKEEK